MSTIKGTNRVSFLRKKKENNQSINHQGELKCSDTHDSVCVCVTEKKEKKEKKRLKV